MSSPALYPLDGHDSAARESSMPTGNTQISPEARTALRETYRRLESKRKWDLLAALRELVARAGACQNPIRMANHGYMQPVFRMAARDETHPDVVIYPTKISVYTDRYRRLEVRRVNDIPRGLLGGPSAK